MHVHTAPCHRLPRPGLTIGAALSLALIPGGPLAEADESAPRAAFSIQPYLAKARPAGSTSTLSRANSRLMS